MTLFCSTFFALWLAAATGNVQRIDEPALRRLAEFPHLNVEQGYIFRAIPFRGEGEFLIGPTAAVNGPPAVDRQEMARVRAALKGNVSDASGYAQLADMLEDLGEDAKEMRQKAAELFRRSLKDGRQIRVPRFASVLVQLEDLVGAEKLLTNAVAKNPSWREWAQLSFLQIDLIVEDLGLTNASLNVMDYPDAFAKVKRAHPTEAQFARARARLEESRRCTQKAVAAAPQEPTVYVAKATILVLHRRLEWLLAAREISSAEVAGDEVMNDVADLIEQVARLRPNDPVPWATVPYYLAGQAGPGAWDPVDGFKLPSKRKAQLENALARLDHLSKSTSSNISAASLSAIGFFDFALKNNPWGAEQKFRRALELDSTSEEAWRGLCGVLGVTGRFSKLKGLAEDRLKVRETPATYILLGKCCAKLNEREESESAVKKALALDPADPLANLALAALFLAGAAKSSVADISRMLDRAEIKSAKLSDAQQIDLKVIRGIELALAGNVSEARAKWTDALRREPANEAARRALALVGE